MSPISTSTGVVDVVGLGICTPLGTSALATQAAATAGIVRFRATGREASDGSPIRASYMPTLDAAGTRAERILALASVALKEALGDLPDSVFVRQPKGTAHGIPLFLALPESCHGSPVEVEDILRGLLKEPLARILGVSQDRLFPSGRAAFFHALVAAGTWLAEGRVSFAVVGGADSLCDSASLDVLATEDRLLGSSNVDGLLPGEGAAFVVLASRESVEVDAPKTKARLRCSAVGQESRHFRQTEPNLADGLTDVFRSVRSALSGNDRRAGRVYSCQTGESYWAQEFVKAYLRNTDIMPEPLVVRHVAASFGDIGSAAGAVQLGLAQYDLDSRRGGLRRALIYGSSDGGAVGACVLEASPG